jgi:hypothetical protein
MYNYFCNLDTPKCWTNQTTEYNHRVLPPPPPKKINLISTVLGIFINSLSLKTDVNVPTSIGTGIVIFNNRQQKKLREKVVFCWRLKDTAKNAGSGSASIVQKYGTEDSDLNQNVRNPERYL